MPDNGTTLKPLDQFKREIWREYKSGKISYKQYMLQLRMRMKLDDNIVKEQLSKLINHGKSN